MVNETWLLEGNDENQGFFAVQNHDERVFVFTRLPRANLSFTASTEDIKAPTIN